MNKIQIIFFPVIFLIASSLVAADNCGGAVQCHCGDNLTSSQVMWYDIINCNGLGLFIGENYITLDCNGHLIDNERYSPGGAGLWANKINYATIKNCHITQFYDGIHFTSGRYDKIINNNLDWNSIGFRDSYGWFNTLKGNTISHNSYGYYSWGTYFNNITNNLFKDNIWYGVDLESNSAYNLIWNNIFINTTMENAIEQNAANHNSWNLSHLGNSWDDFENNTGFPNHYYIPGTPDGTDWYPIYDSDGDGHLNSVDNCPFNYNPGQENYDTDSLGNACDNCINEYNPGQEDIDGNGQGDICQECEPILYNGEGKYNVVFVPAFFEEGELNTEFHSAVLSNWNSTATTTPFSNHLSSFNVWEVNDLNDQGLDCHQDCWNLRYPAYWCCDHGEAKDLAKACKNRDTIVVLIDATTWTGYRSGWPFGIGSDVIVKAKNNPIIFRHELGHSLGLGDEYSPYTSNAAWWDQRFGVPPNCDFDDQCSKWNGASGCNQGCEYLNDHRQLLNSIMRLNSITDGFSPVAYDHIVSELTKYSSQLLKSSMITGDLNKVYVMDLFDDNNTFSLVEVAVEEGFPQEEGGSYRYEILRDDVMLYSGFFNDPLNIYIQETPPEDGNVIPINLTMITEADITLILPYFFEGNTIRLYDSENILLLELNVSAFIDLDEDGYVYIEDCDDSNAQVNPGVMELCRTAYDDNCNGKTNEGCDISGTGSPVFRKPIVQVQSAD